MEPLERVRRLGFRKWYERQLIEGHAYFVTCFICMILVAASLEASRSPELGFDRPLMFLLACLGGALGLFSWRRYRISLENAEHFAEAAVCPSCGAYGAFKVISACEGEGPDAAASRLRVQCRKCPREWTIQ